MQPGAVRIASTSFGTTGWNGQIMDVAFRNPDGSTVLVAHNENDNPQSFAVSEGGQSFDYTLPGGALATFVWPAAPRPCRRPAPARPRRLVGDRRTRTGPTTPAAQVMWRRTPSTTTPATRYSSGAAQTPGQYLQVDLGRAQRLRQVVFDTGASHRRLRRAATR